MSESKHEKFIRIAKRRTESIVHEISLLSNLSNNSNYEYTKDEVEKIFRAISKETKRAKALFDKNSIKFDF